MRDAADLASALGLTPLPWLTAPGVADIQTAQAEGKALRDKYGHYLGAMFYSEGEWYWGLNRLPYLEQRLKTRVLGKAITPFVPQLRQAMTPAPDALR